MLGFGLVIFLLPLYARKFRATGTQLGFLTAVVPLFVCGVLAFLSMILVAFLVEETFRSKWNVEESQA